MCRQEQLVLGVLMSLVGSSGCAGAAGVRRRQRRQLPAGAGGVRGQARLGAGGGAGRHGPGRRPVRRLRRRRRRSVAPAGRPLGPLRLLAQLHPPQVRPEHRKVLQGRRRSRTPLHLRLQPLPAHGPSPVFFLSIFSSFYFSIDSFFSLVRSSARLGPLRIKLYSPVRRLFFFFFKSLWVSKAADDGKEKRRNERFGTLFSSYVLIFFLRKKGTENLM